MTKINTKSDIIRNPGIDFQVDKFCDLKINLSAVEQRCQEYAKRRSIKKEKQAAWLLKVVSLIDLTTLSGDDTRTRVRRLCKKALNPINEKTKAALDIGDLNLKTAAVCVYHEMLSEAATHLKGTGVHLAAVSTGFPAGLSPLPLRIEEIKYSVEAGADEIDIVISRRHVLEGNWEELYNEVKMFREACGEAHLKTILATGELGNLTNIAKASVVCMMAGADFIKTSTGKEPTNATLPVSLVMARMIRDYYESTGYMVGFKPAGGISDTKTALQFMTLMQEELGRRWLEPDLFRFGASSLLGDIERQLDHFTSGYYSAAYRHPLA
ncbi:MAG TPA: deoxyribose-phosphate aldolase [Flavobacteriales bacterium]|jgi:deoxyribose-phosphate aldolase|nr:deoxyribose-phosphate aldolase [Flavobacteriales bacterium]HHZ95896.1 deoxyribose-phosphate aldolase [Flavobacteriales bacterium]HIB78322.1 deoxyribose-phosphate aldolase [Flavobacteriales bacterium]HIN40930.1 deoxyribose-phosphate aldolase [Flavobacteriales bacterium]HIO16824.1 deoxyribose-phosphate aldolase [Flavobacteriales bacterium]